MVRDHAAGQEFRVMPRFVSKLRCDMQSDRDDLKPIKPLKFSTVFANLQQSWPNGSQRYI